MQNPEKGKTSNSVGVLSACKALGNKEMDMIVAFYTARSRSAAGIVYFLIDKKERNILHIK